MFETISTPPAPHHTPPPGAAEAVAVAKITAEATKRVSGRKHEAKATKPAREPKKKSEPATAEASREVSREDTPQAEPQTRNPHTLVPALLDRLDELLKETGSTFAASLDRWLRVGQTGHEIVALAKAGNAVPGATPLNVKEALTERFGAEALSNLRRAMRLAAPARKRTKARPFDLPEGRDALPKAIAWAEANNETLPGSLKAADGLLRRYNRATIPGYDDYLAAQEEARKLREEQRSAAQAPMVKVPRADWEALRAAVVEFRDVIAAAVNTLKSGEDDAADEVIDRLAEALKARSVEARICPPVEDDDDGDDGSE